MKTKFAMQVWAANEIKKWKRQKKIRRKKTKEFPAASEIELFLKKQNYLITKQGEKYGRILFVLLFVAWRRPKLWRFEWKVMPCCWLVFFLLMKAQIRPWGLLYFHYNPLCSVLVIVFFTRCLRSRHDVLQRTFFLPHGGWGRERGEEEWLERDCEITL